jgi:hypothetical protein
MAEKQKSDANDPAAEADKELLPVVAEEAQEPGGDPVLEAQRELERATNRLADAKDKVKRDDEIAKAIEKYRAVQLQLEAAESGLKAQRREGLEELAPTEEEKQAVEAARDEVKDEIDDLRDSIARRRERLEDDREALARGKAELAETKDEFEALKNLGKGVQDKHRTAETLRDEAFEAIPKRRRLAYYLLEHRLGRTVDGEPKPVEMARFDREIRQKSAEYGSESRRLADFEAAIKRREKALADDEKRLAELRKNRDSAIRELLAPAA